jgi:hypothetical protein
MKYIHELAKKIAPLTKEQYEAKITTNKKKAYDLITSITCNHRSVCLRGKRHIGGYTHEDILKFNNWNPRTQCMTIIHGFNIYEMSRKDAEEHIYAYLMMDYKEDFFFI